MKISNLGAIVAVTFLVLGAAIPSAVLADTPAVSEQASSGDAVPEKKRKKKSKRVCKREKVSGSNMKKRVCRTVREMEERADSDRRFVRSIQRPAGTISN